MISVYVGLLLAMYAVYGVAGSIVLWARCRKAGGVLVVVVEAARWEPPETRRERSVMLLALVVAWPFVMWRLAHPGE